MMSLGMTERCSFAQMHHGCAQTAVCFALYLICSCKALDTHTFWHTADAWRQAGLSRAEDALQECPQRVLQTGQPARQRGEGKAPWLLWIIVLFQQAGAVPLVESDNTCRPPLSLVGPAEDHTSEPRKQPLTASTLAPFVSEIQNIHKERDNYPCFGHLRIPLGFSRLMGVVLLAACCSATAARSKSTNMLRTKQHRGQDLGPGLPGLASEPQHTTESDPTSPAHLGRCPQNM